MVTGHGCHCCHTATAVSLLSLLLLATASDQLEAQPCRVVNDGFSSSVALPLVLVERRANELASHPGMPSVLQAASHQSSTPTLPVNAFHKSSLGSAKKQMACRSSDVMQCAVLQNAAHGVK